MNTEDISIDPAPDADTGVLITLKVSAPEGEALVAEWNKAFPAPYSHSISLVPERFFDDEVPQTHYWGFLQQISPKVHKLLGEDSRAADIAWDARQKARYGDVGGGSTEGLEGPPYLELFMYPHKLAAEAALTRCRALDFMVGCPMALVEIELAESHAPFGPMSA